MMFLYHASLPLKKKTTSYTFLVVKSPVMSGVSPRNGSPPPATWQSLTRFVPGGLPAVSPWVKDRWLPPFHRTKNTQKLTMEMIRFFRIFKGSSIISWRFLKEFPFLLTGDSSFHPLYTWYTSTKIGPQLVHCDKSEASHLIVGQVTQWLPRWAMEPVKNNEEIDG